ncbi:MAG: riboflavin synthase, partial [Candidatus Omnitrophica bacterium]|nr:riboflavin synthase [Candidatus Omnitrophota bacterium]
LAQRRKKSTITTFTIQAPVSAQSASASDSIAINGVCLTVTRKEKNLLVFDAVAPTLIKTNLATMRIGDRINIEPALKVGGTLGGHFVLGHIDATAKLVRVINKRNYWQVTLALPVKKYGHLVENGSIAVEGVSLTVKKFSGREITLDIIPFTYLHTTLQYKKPGSWLNMEFDYLLKKLEAEKR